MNKILFFATYPNETNIKDGMIQRINAVDGEFEGWHRTYVMISFLKYFRKRHEVKKDKNVEVYQLNIFTHVFLIRKLIRENTNIYIHSVHNFCKLYPFCFKGKKVTIDLHGAVPEELAFVGHPLYGRMMAMAERRAFRVCSNFIHVSEEMRDFYTTKYPFVGKRVNEVKPIYSTNAFCEPTKEATDALRRELGIGENDTVLLYSGNTQKWQNFELTIQTMCKCQRPNYFFIILTGDLKYAQMLFDKYDTKNMRYCIRSVSPSELSAYYSIAHYGFILRDEHILNKVAAPTKMVEYLYFGLTPIVKYERIGDSFRLGYVHISFSDDLSDLKPVKCGENTAIAKCMLEQNKKVRLDTLYE